MKLLPRNSFKVAYKNLKLVFDLLQAHKLFHLSTVICILLDAQSQAYTPSVSSRSCALDMSPAPPGSWTRACVGPAGT